MWPTSIDPYRYSARPGLVVFRRAGIEVARFEIGLQDGDVEQVIIDVFNPAGLASAPAGKQLEWLLNQFALTRGVAQDLVDRFGYPKAAGPVDQLVVIAGEILDLFDRMFAGINMWGDPGDPFIDFVRRDYPAAG